MRHGVRGHCPRWAATASAVLAGAAALQVGAAGPAGAGQVAVTTTDGTVTVTVDDVQWVADDCQSLPVTAVGSVGAGVSWRVDVTARRSGSGTGLGTSLLGTGAVRRDSSFFACPTTNGSGRYQVSVDLTTTDYSTSEQPAATATGTTTFTVSRMPSRATVTKVRLQARGPVVRGRLTVTSSEYGRIGADLERVSVQQRPPGASGWHRMGTGTTDEMGRVEVVGLAAKPAGTRFRLVYRGGTVAEPATSAVVVG